MSPKISIALGVLALLIPATALAYGLPADVFGTGDPAYVQPPPTPREAAEVVRLREAAIAQSRKDQQLKAAAAAAPPPEPTLSSSTAPKVDRSTDEYQYQLRQQRLENSSQNTVIVIDNSGKVLHSGAPFIAATGPQSIVAIVLVLLATVGTLVGVWRRT